MTTCCSRIKEGVFLWSMVVRIQSSSSTTVKNLFSSFWTLHKKTEKSKRTNYFSQKHWYAAIVFGNFTVDMTWNLEPKKKFPALIYLTLIFRHSVLKNKSNVILSFLGFLVNLSSYWYCSFNRKRIFQKA